MPSSTSDHRFEIPAAPSPRVPASAPAPGRRYCLISPCRDEEATLERTLRCVAAQTLPPALHVVVDDGSTDRTQEILARLAKEMPFLRVVLRADRGKRSVGPGVIEAFYAGLESIRVTDFDYICKLDVDLDLPPRYFETLVERMERDPRIGALSGKPFFHPAAIESAALVPEPCGDDICVGMAKFYRRECFEAVGGFVRAVMWDGIDAHTSRMLGWKNLALGDESLRFVHLRPMGSSDKSVYKGRVRWGQGQYFMGTSFLYLLASAVNRIATPPAVLGSLCMIYGWCEAWFHARPRYGTPEFRAFLRRYQWLALTRGKTRACELVLGNRQNPE